MSEESLQRAEQAIDDARKAAAEAPIMPFDDGPAGATPEETGGAVAEHGNDEPENREVEQARTQIGQGSTEEGRSVNAAADAAEAEATDQAEAGGA
jgi:hypothetical protein